MNNDPLKLIQDIEKELDKVRGRISELSYDVRTLQSDAKRLEETIKTLNGQVVTKIEFTPVKSLVFGAVGLMLTLLIGAIVALVVAK